MVLCGVLGVDGGVDNPGMEGLKMANETKAPETDTNCVTGHVVEIGDLDCLDGNPGIVISTTREQLKAYGRNLAFADVAVRAILNATGGAGRRA